MKTQLCDTCKNGKIISSREDFEKQVIKKSRISGITGNSYVCNSKFINIFHEIGYQGPVGCSAWE